MGSWIEIDYMQLVAFCSLVAPYMGSWIEIISLYLQAITKNNVAPYMGSWIEIETTFRCAP